MTEAQALTEIAIALYRIAIALNIATFGGIVLGVAFLVTLWSNGRD